VVGFLRVEVVATQKTCHHTTRVSVTCDPTSTITINYEVGEPGILFSIFMYPIYSS
jgi:hypothetical protein